jgi:hypothetical protein
VAPAPPPVIPKENLFRFAEITGGGAGATKKEIGKILLM